MKNTKVRMHYLSYLAAIDYVLDNKYSNKEKS